MKTRSLIVAALALLSAAASALGRAPTEFEQYMLELINRARANPGAEVTRLSSLTWGDNIGFPAVPSLNEGLAPGTISDTFRQPLAFDFNIIDAASNYSDTLLANDAFTHGFGGTSPNSRMTAAGYPFTPSFGNGENLSVTASTVFFPITKPVAAQHHSNLFIDGGVSGRGHRLSILNSNWREIGIGIRSGSDYDLFNPPDLFAVLTTQDFAFSSAPGHTPAFLTGVAYNDLDLDLFYTPGIGEALAGLMVNVFQQGTSTLVASTTTYSSGGYALLLSAGVYDVEFTGPGVNKKFLGVNFSATQNVKIDAVNPVPEPATTTLLLTLSATGLLLRSRRS